MSIISPKKHRILKIKWKTKLDEVRKIEEEKKPDADADRKIWHPHNTADATPQHQWRGQLYRDVACSRGLHTALEFLNSAFRCEWAVYKVWCSALLNQITYRHTRSVHLAHTHTPLLFTSLNLHCNTQANCSVKSPRSLINQWRIWNCCEQPSVRPTIWIIISDYEGYSVKFIIFQEKWLSNNIMGDLSLALYFWEIEGALLLQNAITVRT